MNRKEFEEKYLGKFCTVKLFDGTVISGIMHKTGTEEWKHEANLYYKHNYYFCATNGQVDKCIFRKSHITKIRALWG